MRRIILFACALVPVYLTNVGAGIPVFDATNTATTTSNTVSLNANVSIQLKQVETLVLQLKNLKAIMDATASIYGNIQGTLDMASELRTLEWTPSFSVNFTAKASASFQGNMNTWYDQARNLGYPKVGRDMFIMDLNTNMTADAAARMSHNERANAFEEVAHERHQDALSAVAKQQEADELAVKNIDKMRRMVLRGGTQNNQLQIQNKLAVMQTQAMIEQSANKSELAQAEFQYDEAIQLQMRAEDDLQRRRIAAEAAYGL